MRVYTLEGVDMIHIAEFSDLLGRSVQSTRRIIENGNAVRKLKSYRDRSRLMIPVSEITGYPFVNAGHSDNAREIFHFRFVEDGKVERYFCEKCTYGQGCEERIKADAAIIPEGDK